jgi:hypothetical protein
MNSSEKGICMVIILVLKAFFFCNADKNKSAVLLEKQKLEPFRSEWNGVHKINGRHAVVF